MLPKRPSRYLPFGMSGDNKLTQHIQDIERLKYRVIVVNPEALADQSGFGTLWRCKAFTSRIFNITFDEGHCISEWGRSFRAEYKEVHALKWLVPNHIRFHVASATMTPYLIRDVKALLQIEPRETVIIRRSNDRPNIHLMVEKMQHSAKSLIDVDRILRLDKTGTTPPPKFMIFADNREETQRIAGHLREQLPQDQRHKIVWFHSGMSTKFRKDIIDDLKKGRIWGIVCTDAAGMVRQCSQTYDND